MTHTQAGTVDLYHLAEFIYRSSLRLHDNDRPKWDLDGDLEDARRISEDIESLGADDLRTLLRLVTDIGLQYALKCQDASGREMVPDRADRDRAKTSQI